MKNVLFVVFAFLICSCGRNASVNARLNEAKTLMNDRPDSALAIIQSIDRSAITRTKTEALYALYYSQALDKNAIDEKKDTLARVAKEYFQEHGNTIHRVMSLYYLGRVYENAGDQDRAIDMLVQAEVASRRIKEDYPYMRGLVCETLGRCYDMQSGTEEALEYFQQAEQAYAKAGRLQNVGRACAGQSAMYYRLNNYTAARDRMRQSFAYFEQTDCPKEQLAGLRGWLSVLEVITDSTLTNKDLIVTLRKHLSDVSDCHAVAGFVWLAILHEREGNIDSACYYAKRLIAAKDMAHNEMFALDILYHAEKKSGNNGQALDYFERKVELDDSVREARRISAGQSVTRRLSAEQLQFEHDLLQTRSRYQLIVGVLSLLLVGVLIWQLIHVIRMWKDRMKRLKRVEEMRRNDLSKRLTAISDGLRIRCADLEEKLERLIMPKSRELSFDQALERRMNGLKAIVENAYKFKTKPESILDELFDYTRINPYAKKETMSDLEYVVNKKFNGVVGYLRHTYPDMNIREIEYCCMVCFGFSATGISFMYSYEDSGSLYNKRCRLRQKLGVKSLPAVDRFLKGLCRKLVAEREEFIEKKTGKQPVSKSI